MKKHLILLLLFTILISLNSVYAKTIGYETKGGTEVTLDAGATGTLYNITEGGNITELHAYFYHNYPSATTCYVAIYNNTDHLQWEDSTSCGAGFDGWKDFTVSGGVLIQADTNFRFALGSDSASTYAYYDSGWTAQTSFGADPTMPDPWSEDYGTADRKYSIYGNYTPYSFNTAPTWSGNVSSTPTSYSSNVSIFNVTWADDVEINGYNFSYFESNFSGTDTNYTTVRFGNISSYNNTLPAGNHYFKFYANDSSDAWNSTDKWEFSIPNATPTLTGTVTTPIDYETASDYSGSESNDGNNGCTYILLRNGTQIDTGSSVSDNTVLGFGIYNYTYYTLGCANYTGGSDEDMLTVDAKSVTVTLGGITGQTITYETSVTPTCTCTGSTLFVCFPSLYRDDVNVTDTENNTAMTYGYKATAYDFECNLTLESLNYSYTNQSSTLTVNQKNANVQVSPSTQTKTYPHEAWQYCKDESTLLSCSIYRDLTSITNNTKITLSVTSYNYEANLTDDTNYTNWQATSTLTISQNTSTQNFMNLTLNGTEINRTYTYPTVVNATGWYNSLFNGQDITFTLYRNDTSQGTTNPVSDEILLGNGSWNFTYYTPGNANYSSAIKDYWLFVNRGTGAIYSFSLNDTTYIHMNESTLLVVNASDNADISFEIQKPSGSDNYTTSHNGSHYTKAITKTELGDTQENVSAQINITRIYLDGQNYTWTSNTTTLNFTYATTNHTSSASPTETYSAEGDSITWTSTYNEEVTNNNISSGCTLNVFGNSYSLDHSSTTGKYTRTISTYNVDPASHTWTINCTNSSYQSQSSEGTIIVRTGSTPAGYTGGGGGRGPIITEEPEVIVVYGNVSFEITRPYTGQAELMGIPGKKSSEEFFDIKNTGQINLSLDIVCIDEDREMCNWVTIIQPENLKLQLDPGETKSVYYYLTIPISQPSCLTPCRAFKIQAIDPESHLFVSYISKWSFLPVGGLRELLLTLSQKFFRIRWVGTPSRRLPLPMVLIPFAIAVSIGYITWKAKFTYWAGLVGLISFILVMIFI